MTETEKPSSQTLIANLYGQIVPQSVRRTLSHVRRAPPGSSRRALSHELGWHIQNPRRRAQRLSRKLLGDRGCWCFILGVNNSGTTLLDRILGGHAEVRTLPGEGHAVTTALPIPWRHNISRLWSERLDVFRWTEADDPAPAWRALHDWAFYYRSQTGRVLLEKSPPDTIRSRWLQRWFQPSQFLVLVRNPYAVCEGIRRRTGQPIEAAALHWSTANEILFDDLGSLDRHLCVCYEDLCANPVDMLRRISEFLELKIRFDPESLGRLEVHNIHGQPSAIQNFNEETIARLSADDIRTINRIAGPTIEKLHYPLVAA